MKNNHYRAIEEIKIPCFKFHIEDWIDDVEKFEKPEEPEVYLTIPVGARVRLLDVFYSESAKQYCCVFRLDDDEVDDTVEGPNGPFTFGNCYVALETFKEKFEMRDEKE